MHKLLLRSLLVILVLTVSLIGAGWLWLRTSLPKLDGTLALPGLDAPVEIVRDSNAIPHVYAETDHDLFMAVGFVHAQDRLWQMHLQRSIAAGRLTELVGARRDENGESDNVDTDKFLRTMGIYRAAEEAWDHISQETKENLESYAAGVNAYLSTRRGALPPEFLAVGVNDIREWSPIDSLAWLKMMMWDLGGNRSTELMNFVLSSVVSSTDLATLNGTYPGDETFVLPDLNQLYGRKPMSAMAFQAQDLTLPSIELPPHEGVGSNNWVASGDRTASGKPLLANDPHLGISAPAIWYYVGMHSKETDYRTLGASLPGIPYVVLGRTDQTAWGFTNVGPDVQDYFLERIDPENEAQYETPNGMKAFERFEEIIRVPGEDDVVLTVRETRHGPVLSDIWDEGRSAHLPDGLVASFRWTALDDDDTSMDAMRMLSRIKSVNEIDAFAPFMIAPQQNVVFADRNGGTHYIAPARVPVRGPDNLTSGMAPGLGWDAAYDWQGYIPYADIPRIVQPDLRVTANAKIVADDYPYHIRRDWSAPYRTDRIVDLLGQDDALTVERFQTVQLDFRANQAAELAPEMLSRISNVPALQNGIYADAIAVLARWQEDDFLATEDSAAMLVWAPWLRSFLIKVMSDEVAPLRPAAMTYRRFFERELVLGYDNGLDASRWCGSLPDQPGTPQDCDALLVSSFKESVDQLVAQYGADIETWRWASEHVAISRNSVFGGLPLIGNRASIQRAIGGSNHSVNVQAYPLMANASEKMFYSKHAPSLRHIFDFDDLDNSLFIYNAGQSGNILSAHYDSFATDWANGAYRRMTMDRTDIEQGSLGTLRLAPTAQ